MISRIATCCLCKRIIMLAKPSGPALLIFFAVVPPPPPPAPALCRNKHMKAVHRLSQFACRLSRSRFFAKYANSQRESPPPLLASLAAPSKL